jgi:hypothetical protein
MDEMKDVVAGGFLGLLASSGLELLKTGIRAITPSEYQKGVGFVEGLIDLGIAGYSWTEYKKPKPKMEESFWGSLTLMEGVTGTLKTVPAIVDFALSLVGAPSAYGLPSVEQKLRAPKFG